ncbi:DeoR family transcriptional regulator [Paenibacillus taihuensis]|uniref:DeoR family transcriptional regulator n=1 Tax=Paenibacillus taihuensis TaxID=1156355 RepID=A0A3D9QUM0_9BACL|nr:DeoR/GlpR family DNA-binding transcription regulator [Paenibacillus taihuensis]REE67318.1 DeoR family transcriptional regulator [Paenibacillus taihuensis]
MQNDRQDEIIKRIKAKKSVRIGELTKSLNVTRETIRRDLYELEKLGIVKKVHGGAVLNRTCEEPPYAQRSVSRIEAKRAIAVCAADLVEDGDTLFIDLGTTALLFAGAIKHKQNITVITNSLPAAIELATSASVKIILCGGELRQGDLSLSGPIAVKTLDTFHVDKTFIGAGGITLAHGITDYHVGEADIRRQMIDRSKETIVLADYSKFNVTVFTQVCELANVRTIVTDDSMPAEEVRFYSEHGVNIMIAK